MPRISLRQLLLLIALVAVAIVSLKYASPLLLAFVGLLVMFGLIAAIIVGIVDRGPRQAFAIGFFIAMLVYVLLIKAGFPRPGQSEPTTVLLDELYGVVAKSVYVDQTNGRIVPDDKAQQLLSAWNNTFGQTGAAPSIVSEVRPRFEAFVSIGQLWCALALGYLGGRFAQFVYLRRTQDQSPARE